MSYLEARNLIVKALALAIDVDGSSGGNIRLNDIKSTGTDREELVENKEIR